VLALALFISVAWMGTFRPPPSLGASIPGDGPVAEWPAADGNGGAHASPLSDITPERVASLEVAWTYRTGDVNNGKGDQAGSAFEATPIMVDGTLFISSPFSRVHAIDAETGEGRWIFDPHLDRNNARQAMTTSRGVATWRDTRLAEGQPCRQRILFASFDAHLFALDARTGLPCQDFGTAGRVDLGSGVNEIDGKRHIFKQTAPPTIVGDMVVVGSSIFDGQYVDSPSGLVRGFDVRTGEWRWSWEPLSRLAGEEIPAGPVSTGAANSWATIIADETRDLVFVPTGSASPDHWGGFRPGDNLYANSVVALRASTGVKVWHFQVVHHDLWDYDLPTPPALVTLQRNGADVPALVQATKTGHLFVLHRETGEPLFPVEERAVPASDVPGEIASPTQPFPVLPRALVPQALGPGDVWGLTPFDQGACREKLATLRSEGIYTPPSLRGSVAVPGFLGGMEWGGVAFDQASGLLLTNTNNLAMVTTLIPVAEAGAAETNNRSKTSLARQTPAPYVVRREPLLSPLGIPCIAPPWGMLHAVDLQSGAVKWETPLGGLRDLSWVSTPRAWGSPNLGGPLVTGGLVFIAAALDHRFRAFALATGKLVWERDLPASAQATPMTYRVRSGSRQLIVIAAGGHAGLGSKLGDYVVAFALHK